MRVRVDEARQQRRVAEIDDARAGRNRPPTDTIFSPCTTTMAPSEAGRCVEQVGGLEYDGLRGGCRRGRGGRGGGDEQRGGHSQERGKARRAGVSGLRHEYVRCVGVAQSRGSVRRGAMPPAHVPATGVLRI